jgi:D-xylose transport system permease protein
MTSNSERVRDPGGPASGRLQLSGFRRGGGRTGADRRGSGTVMAGAANWYASGRTAAIALVTVLVWIGFDLDNSRFLSGDNIAGLIDQIVPVGVLSVGMAVVLLSGEIDLSGAAVGGVAATVAARLAVGDGLPAGLALLIGLACAVAITLVEALIITGLGVPSFITTLGGMIALGGVLLLVLPSTFEVNLAGTSLGAINTTEIPAWVGYAIAAVSAILGSWAVLAKHRSGSGQPPAARRAALALRLGGVLVLCAIGVVTSWVLGGQGGIPVPVLAMIAIVVLGELALRKTAFGVHLLAVGGSRASARRAGLSTRVVVCGAFAVLGVMAFLSGIFDASLDLGVSASSGPSSEVLDAIASVVVGGTSLFGGAGSITSALVGVALIGSITNGLLLLGVSVALQSIVTGLILVAAVAVDMLLSRRAATGQARA